MSPPRPLDEGPSAVLSAADRAQTEAALAEVLAELLRLDRVPVDGNFFQELGADSLVMAHFCARLRKRGSFPPVSIKDVYSHPTISSLAAAITQTAPAPVAPTVVEKATPTSGVEYVSCAVLQALFYLG